MVNGRFPGSKGGPKLSPLPRLDVPALSDQAVGGGFEGGACR